MFCIFIQFAYANGEYSDKNLTRMQKILLKKAKKFAIIEPNCLIFAPNFQFMQKSKWRKV